MSTCISASSRTPVKCRCADADVKHVKCGEILWRLSVNVMARVRHKVKLSVIVRVRELLLGLGLNKISSSYMLFT